jgi:class 3 adenylate cyclase
MNETATGPVLLSVSAFGMALAFLWAERNSPSSRLLSATLALLGGSVLLNAGVRLAWPYFGLAWRAVGVAEGATLATFLQWILTLSRRNARQPADPRWLYAGQCAAIAYVAVASVAPHLRIEQFAGHLAAQPWRPGFWLFAAPMLLGAAAAIVAVTQLMRGGMDRAERSRLAGVVASAPLLVGALIAPAPANDIMVGFGLVLFVAGVLRYHALRGHEGQFLTRFLSPQVLHLIQQRGLRESLRSDCIELTVVSCDLRGFTRYTQTHPTEYALQLLREYYQVVGRATASFGGTLKDFVGDGALILIGAPLRVAEHADTALSLASLLRQDVEHMLKRWSPRLHRLGVGIGVASGAVQVGIVASDSRYEYVAVGPAVNLASRLCESAESSQILVAPETAALTLGWRERLQPGPSLTIKGVEGPMQTRLLSAPVPLPGLARLSWTRARTTHPPGSRTA